MLKILIHISYSEPFSVVLLFGSQQMVRDMMLQAYDAGKTNVLFWSCGPGWVKEYVLKNLHLLGHDRFNTDWSGMTQSNEYAFIIIPTNYFPLYSWKADPAYSKLYWEEGQASRDEDARKAFQVKLHSYYVILTSTFLNHDSWVMTGDLNLL